MMPMMMLIVMLLAVVMVRMMKQLVVIAHHAVPATPEEMSQVVGRPHRIREVIVGNLGCPSARAMRAKLLGVRRYVWRCPCVRVVVFVSGKPPKRARGVGIKRRGKYF